MKHLSKRAHKKAKRGAHFSLVPIILLAVFIVAVFLAFKIYPVLGKPKLDFKSRVNIVLNSSPVAVVTFSPLHTLSVVLIPDDVWAETVYGLGSYKLTSVFELSKNEPQEMEIFKGTISELLSIPVSGYLSLRGEKIRIANGFDNLKLREYKNNISGLGLLGFLSSGNFSKIESDIPLMDLIKLFKLNSEIRFSDVTLIDLAQNAVVSKIILPNGDEAESINTDKLMSVLGESFYEPQIKSENLKIDIYNGTDIPGLGNRIGKIISIMGGVVIMVGNSEVVYDKCRIFGSSEAIISQTARRLALVFGCDIENSPMENSRADLSLVVGNSYQKFLFGK